MGHKIPIQLDSMPIGIKKLLLILEDETHLKSE